MNTQTILVVGGTGMLGEQVARRLRRDGFEVRLLARDVERARTLLGPDFEYCVGDVDSPDAVERALEGCAGVHVSLRGGSDPDELDRKPTYFMDTLPRHVQGTLAIVLGRQPHPLHVIAASDFTRMVSRSFQTPEAANRIFFVQGPEAITIPEALRLYCSLAEPGKRVVSMPLWFMSLVDGLFMRGELRGTIQLMRVMQRVGERGDPSEANEVLGAPTTTLRRWCKQQRTRDPAERRAETRR